MPITVTNLTCVYGAGTPFETTALRDVSVTVENGSFVGILGRTGGPTAERGTPMLREQRPTGEPDGCGQLPARERRPALGPEHR